MTDSRLDDTSERKHYRSERFFEANGEWFFYTREGEIKGPYADRHDAEVGLQAFIKVMTSPFAPGEHLGIDED